MRRVVAALIAAALVALPARASEPLEQGSVATLPPVGGHWVWVADALLVHSLLFDGDTAEVVATIDAGTTLSPKPPLFSPTRREFYSVEIDYSRGRRGDRIDYVTIYDAETLAVTGEVVLPTRTSESASSVGYSALLDGGRFLATFNQFPATSVSIVDLRDRSFVGEIPTTGCAGIYPTGERSFAMLCGDGSVLSVELDETGRRHELQASPPFFDVVADPVMMAGGRTGDRWIFVSFHGIAHEIDFGQAPAVASSWPLVGEAERDAGWRPGGRQLLALHGASGRLFVTFHQGGPGSHKDPGPEVWVFDLAERERVDRFEMPNFTAAFLGRTLGIGPDGFMGWLLESLLPDRGADTIAVSQDTAPLLFARSSALGVVAVLDARTGEHLRDLTEVGLAGMRLEVP
jgi:methylamine dehydrogenase heavy chain